jgi:hypothetical protein
MSLRIEMFQEKKREREEITRKERNEKEVIEKKKSAENIMPNDPPLQERSRKKSYRIASPLRRQGIAGSARRTAHLVMICAVTTRSNQVRCQLLRPSDGIEKELALRRPVMETPQL